MVPLAGAPRYISKYVPVMPYCIVLCSRNCPCNPLPLSASCHALYPESIASAPLLSLYVSDTLMVPVTLSLSMYPEFFSGITCHAPVTVTLICQSYPKCVPGPFANCILQSVFVGVPCYCRYPWAFPGTLCPDFVPGVYGMYPWVFLFRLCYVQYISLNFCLVPLVMYSWLTCHNCANLVMYLFVSLPLVPLQYIPVSVSIMEPI